MKHLFLIFISLISLPLLGQSKNKSYQDFCFKHQQLSVSIDALYWQMIQTPMWCYTVTGEVNQTPQIQNFKATSYSFRPGFRINIGYQKNPNSIDTRASYTWYYNKFSGNESGNWITPIFLPGRVLLGHDYYQFAKIDWTAKFNIIDIDIGKTFINSDCLKIRPFIGMKGGWIYQSINGLWQNPIINHVRETIDDYESFLNNFSGLGPKIGVSNDWTFYKNKNCQLDLVGEFQTAYLYGHWNLSDQISTNQPGVTGAYTNVGNRHFGSFVFQGLINLAFSSFICDKAYRFKTSIGYEIQDWLNQYQLVDDLAGANNLSLTLQGITFNIGIDF